MIPDIGLMIGCYVIVRMLVLLNDNDMRPFIKITALVTIVVSVMSISDLLISGTTANVSLPGLN